MWYWIGLFLILFLIFIGFSQREKLMMNDITTTPDNPPLIDGVGLTTEQVKTHKKFYRDLNPSHYPLPEDQLFSLALQTAQSMGWDVKTKGNRIEAVATTPLMGYKDDVVIEVRQEGDSSVIHVRSRSRVGKGDLGANAKRIRTYLSALQKRYKQTQSD